MATPYFAVGQHRIRMGRLTIPKIGTWIADVFSDDEIPAAEIATRCTVTLGAMTLQGCRIRGEAWQGGTRMRIVGGAGGWRRIIPPRYYQIAAGVRASRVALDAATDAGETIGEGLAEDRLLGLWYARKQAAAGQALYALGVPWRAQDDGTTSLQPWPVSRVTAPMDPTAYDAQRGIVEIATDDVGAWRPGRTFTSPRLPSRTFAISDVVHLVDPGKYRVELWCDDV